jgi:hypothetical protein
MGGGADKLLEDTTEGFLGFGGGGFEIQDVLYVAALVAVESSAEFEQDETGAADEAELEDLAVFACVEVLPEAGGKEREVEAAQGGGSVEPIHIEVAVLVHEILFTRPIRMFQQDLKNALGMLIFCELG